MLKVKISNERQNDEVTIEDRAFEFGRGPKRKLDRFCILDSFVSRDQLRLYQLASGQYCVENLGTTLLINDRIQLVEGESQKLELPCRINIGFTTLELSGDSQSRILKTANVEPEDDSREYMTISVSSIRSILHDNRATIDTETISQWFESLIQVQQAAANSGQLFEEAAKAVVELIGLDKGLILLKQDEEWSPKAHFPAIADLERAGFSSRVCDQVETNSLTYWKSVGNSEASQMGSLIGIESVVASPIFDASRRVIGVLYGSRGTDAHPTADGISSLEAQLVHVLASLVGSGLAFAHMESEATRNRTRFEQFASSQLVEALEKRPSLLDGQERPITVMFCDLRGFSAISERLGPQRTYRFLSHAMDVLTDVIFENEGVIIDYYGDGVAAMWNAPCDTEDHANLACNTAAEIVKKSVRLDKEWSSLIKAPVRFGIGISSGNAWVGNAGSSLRLKYGPQGHVVNLASRVEGATKYFNVPILITKETRERIDPQVLVRRVGKIKAVGMDLPVDVFEVFSKHDVEKWIRRRDIYQKALESFESSECARAIDILKQLDPNPMESRDVSTRILYTHAMRFVSDPNLEFAPVFSLSDK